MVLPATSLWVQAYDEAQVVEKTYRPCPNCGFRLMEVMPSILDVDAFSVAYCPVCGFRHDSRGKNSGAVLSQEAKREALRQWLRMHDLDEDLLQKHYHLSWTAFFVENSM